MHFVLIYLFSYSSNQVNNYEIQAVIRLFSPKKIVTIIKLWNKTALCSIKRHVFPKTLYMDKK